MRIAIYLRSLEPFRGAERVSSILAKELSNKGHRVDFLLEDTTGPHTAELAALPGISIVDIGESPSSRLRRSVALSLAFLQNILSIPASLLRGRGTCVRPLLRYLIKNRPPIDRLRNYLTEQQPDSAIAFLSHPSFALLLAARMGRSNTRILVNVRNHISESARLNRSKWVRSVPSLMRTYFPSADRVIALSYGVATDISAITGIPISSISTIYNPVYRPELLELARSRSGHRWLDEPDTRVLVAAGKLKEQKDHPTLLRAFAIVRERHPVRLILLGEGPLRESLMKLVEELGIADDVDMPGEVKNPYAYFARASVFVASSAWEGLMNVLIEAMACGAPAVSTDCPSGPGEILGGGEFGKLVPVGDFASLARAIVETLDNPPLAEKTIKRAREFSVERAVSEYEQALMRS